jgi:large subunit ribosomal protein L24
MSTNRINIKKHDTVEVIAGKEKGKRGKVLRVFPDRERVVVEKVNFIKRHTRPTQENQQGGIVEKEGTLHVSNMMPVCKKCDRPVRVRHQKLKDEKKVRVCAKCAEPMDRV